MSLEEHLSKEGREVPAPEGLPTGWKSFEKKYLSGDKAGTAYLRFCGGPDLKHKNVNSIRLAIRKDAEDRGADPEQKVAEYDRLRQEKDAARPQRVEGGKVAGEKREEAVNAFRERFGALDGPMAAALPGWSWNFNFKDYINKTVPQFTSTDGRTFYVYKDIECFLGCRLKEGEEGAAEVAEMVAVAKKKADPAQFRREQDLVRDKAYAKGTRVLTELFSKPTAIGPSKAANSENSDEATSSPSLRPSGREFDGKEREAESVEEPATQMCGKQEKPDEDARVDDAPTTPPQRGSSAGSGADRDADPPSAATVTPSPVQNCSSAGAAKRGRPPKADAKEGLAPPAKGCPSCKSTLEWAHTLTEEYKEAGGWTCDRKGCKHKSRPSKVGRWTCGKCKEDYCVPCFQKLAACSPKKLTLIFKKQADSGEASKGDEAEQQKELAASTAGSESKATESAKDAADKTDNQADSKVPGRPPKKPTPNPKGEDGGESKGEAKAAEPEKTEGRKKAAGRCGESPSAASCIALGGKKAEKEAQEKQELAVEEKKGLAKAKNQANKVCNCGNEVKALAKFCDECGDRMEAPQESLAPEAAAPATPVPRRRYLVDRRKLKASSSGLAYRWSKKEADKDGHEVAEWDSHVEGCDEGDGWVSVGDRFLPIMAHGCTVLTLAEGVEEVRRTRKMGKQQDPMWNQAGSSKDAAAPAVASEPAGAEPGTEREAKSEPPAAEAQAQKARQVSGYFIFCQLERVNLKKNKTKSTNGFQEQKGVMQELGRIWRKLSDKDKQKYQEEAKAMPPIPASLPKTRRKKQKPTGDSPAAADGTEALSGSAAQPSHARAARAAGGAGGKQSALARLRLIRALRRPKRGRPDADTASGQAGGAEAAASGDAAALPAAKKPKLPELLGASGAVRREGPPPAKRQRGEVAEGVGEQSAEDGPGAAQSSTEGAGEEPPKPWIEEDAPADSSAHTKVKPTEDGRVFYFEIKRGDNDKLRIQATVASAGGCRESAARIARLCYVECEAGADKDRILQFRAELYKKCGNSTARRPQTKERNEVYRNLLGEVVVVTTLAPGTKPPPKAWGELELSDVDLLNSDDIYFYERELKLGQRRCSAERVQRLEQMAQRTTLPLWGSGGGSSSSSSKPSSGSVSSADDLIGEMQNLAAAGDGQGSELDAKFLQVFLAMLPAERKLLSHTEISKLERVAHIADGGCFSIGERRGRLKDRLWDSRRDTTPTPKSAGFWKSWLSRPPEERLAAPDVSSSSSSGSLSLSPPSSASAQEEPAPPVRSAAAGFLKAWLSRPAAEDRASGSSSTSTASPPSTSSPELPEPPHEVSSPEPAGDAAEADAASAAAVAEPSAAVVQDAVPEAGAEMASEDQPEVEATPLIAEDVEVTPENTKEGEVSTAPVAKEEVAATKDEDVEMKPESGKEEDNAAPNEDVEMAPESAKQGDASATDGQASAASQVVMEELMAETAKAATKQEDSKQDAPDVDLSPALA